MSYRFLLLLLISGFILPAGYAQPAKLIKDINPGEGHGGVQLIQLKGTLYFRGVDAEHGTELWKSDGTTKGTRLLKDIYPGKQSSDNSDQSNWAVAKDYLYFLSDDGIHGTELWKTDGTEKGTQLVKDMTPGSAGSLITSMVTIDNTVYFISGINIGFETTTDRELWKSDGTAKGTLLVKDIYPGQNGSDIKGLYANNKHLYFFAKSGVATDYQFWKSDGTGPGTVLIKPTNYLHERPIRFLNGLVYFADIDVWKSDGTAAGTVPITKVKKICHMLTQAGKYLYFFVGTDDTNVELWRSDGTTAGTQLIKTNMNPTGDIIAFWNKVVFRNQDSLHGNELWISDGSTAGTFLLKDMVPGPQSAPFSSFWLGIMSNWLYFSANDLVHGIELWRTDCTPGGTQLVQDISLNNQLGTFESMPKDGVVKYDVSPTLPLPGKASTEGLYFFANDGVHGRELFWLPKTSQ